MSSAMVGRERGFCAPAVYWLSDDESTISDCWRGRAIYRRKSLPSHPQRGPRVVRSLHKSLWSLLPAGKSPFVSQGHREKRTVCIVQKLLQPMSKRRNEKESWKSLEKIKMHWLFWLRETSGSFYFHGACLNAPLIEKRKQQPYGLLKVAKLQL